MEVVDLKDSQCIWVPLDSTAGPETAYEGQLVKSGGDGVLNAGTASGAGDTTTKAVLMGIVIGTNDSFETQTFDDTYKGASIASVVTQEAQAARKFFGVEGMWVKNDPQAFVRIALITPHTRIKVPLYNATYGIAPTLLTVTTGSATGLGFTSNACDFTPVADLGTAFCRTGANAGIYRISDDTSTTVETNDVAFPQDIAIGDTFIRVPMRPFGVSYVQTDAEATFFNVAASPATDYWIFHVHQLNLKEAGKEYAIGTFAPCHFDLVRA